jgi:hypothetical protein
MKDFSFSPASASRRFVAWWMATPVHRRLKEFVMQKFFVNFSFAEG